MPRKTKKKTPAETKKELKLFQNFSRVFTQYMEGKSYLPLSFKELLEKLKIPEEHEKLCAEVLQMLVTDGSVEEKNKRFQLKKQSIEIVPGTIHVHPRGFGFVQPNVPTPFTQDIFIPKHLTQNAVDGDLVEVAINYDVVPEKGPEGKVVSILKRARTHIAGTIKKLASDGTIIAYVPLLGSSKLVYVNPSRDRDLRVGDRLILQVLDWGGTQDPAICEMSHYLGHISDPSCDIPAAIEEYGLRNDFSSNILEDVEKFGSKVSAKDIKDREDFRKLETITIDPCTAKDFDDALSLRKDKKGNYHLVVHIADVAHYVKAGSELDKEARQRCNSTYFPGFCLPMLPKPLSDNLCSLKPRVNRLTISVLMEFDKTGRLQDTRITRAVIKSDKRFTYKEAMKVLEGKLESKYAPTLELMVELCKILKKRRQEKGCVEFALPDMMIKIDENGEPLGLELEEYDITHQLVEEFMIRTNEAIAKHLTEQGQDLTYRIHEEPKEESMKDFASLAAAFGFKLPSKPSPKELQALFDESRDSPFGQQLATQYIRSLRLAVYSETNIGHYGLNLEYYCHFTSPIRRYADLVVQRTLFNERGKEDNIAQIATACSEQERVSAKAENAVKLLKKLRLIDKDLKGKKHHTFDAVITQVKPFGFAFEAVDYLIEGFLHVADLEGDYYKFIEKKLMLRGTYSGAEFACGQKVSVFCSDINLITLETSWAFAPEGRTTPIPAEKRKGKRGKRTGSKSSRTEASKKARAKKPAKSKRTKLAQAEEEGGTPKKSKKKPATKKAATKKTSAKKSSKKKAPAKTKAKAKPKAKKAVSRKKSSK